MEQLHLPIIPADTKVPIKPGLFKGMYGGHGTEIVLLSYDLENNVAQARKITVSLFSFEKFVIFLERIVMSFITFDCLVTQLLAICGQIQQMTNCQYLHRNMFALLYILSILIY